MGIPGIGNLRTTNKVSGRSVSIGVRAGVGALPSPQDKASESDGRFREKEYAAARRACA
jgi:hypothetical protein